MFLNFFRSNKNKTTLMVATMITGTSVEMIPDIEFDPPRWVSPEAYGLVSKALI